MLVLDREPAHRGEAGQDQRVHASLAAAREHGVRVAPFDDLRALADRVRAGGTGSPVASKERIQSIPLSPATAAFQVEGASLPIGVTAPRPVTATRFIA